jgi:hypothetical protein
MLTPSRPHLPLLRPHLPMLLKHNRIKILSPHVGVLFSKGYTDLSGKIVECVIFLLLLVPFVSTSSSLHHCRQQHLQTWTSCYFTSAGPFTSHSSHVSSSRSPAVHAWSASLPIDYQSAWFEGSVVMLAVMWTETTARDGMHFEKQNSASKLGVK